jgi:hypothetical protein
MPVPSVSPFVLVLCGFELGDISVATGITEVSPSRFDGAWLEDVAEAAPTSAGPEVDAVLFRGMTVAGGSLYRILREAGRERANGCGRESSQRAVTFPESRYDNAFFRTRRCEVRGCQVLDQESTCSVGVEGIDLSVSNLEHGASECCVFTLKLY